MTSSLSVIIPVYNGEKHIEKCIKNILEQPIDNIEYIIINDGSKDNTEEILRKYESNSKIRVVNKKNSGVSDTRNLGISMAKNDYILFLDSDDAFEKKSFQEISEQLSKNKTDIFIFGFKVSGSNNRFNDTAVLDEIKKFQNSKNLKDIVLESILKNKNNIYGYIWRGAYSRNFLLDNEIKFDKNLKISEDYKFFIQCILLSNSISISDVEYYNYQIGESSMSIKHIPTLLHDMLYVNNWIKQNIINNNKKLSKYYENNMCNTYLRFVQNVIRNKNQNLHTKIKIIYREKKKQKFEQYLKKSITRKNDFNLKTYISILSFVFYLEFLYAILFNLKENKKS